MENSNFQKYINTLNEKIKPIKDNRIWDIFPIPKGVKPIGCRRTFKTKKDLKGDVRGVGFIL